MIQEIKNLIIVLFFIILIIIFLNYKPQKKEKFHHSRINTIYDYENPPKVNFFKFPLYYLTKPIMIDKQKLRLSADVYEGGYVKVTILDLDNTILAVSQKINQNVTDKVLVFNKNIENKQIKLEFDFQKSTIYSYSLEKN